VYASAFTGAMMNGHAPVKSARIAADYTLACIENTVDAPEHWYGVRFEPVLPRLMELLK
jgi:pyridoxine kinase